MRTLTPEESRKIFSLKRKDITGRLLKDFFAIKGSNKKAKFNTFDKILLPRGKFYNTKEIETTIGRYLFNFFVLPPTFLKKEGYQDTEMTSGELSKIESKMGYMLLDDKLPIKEYVEYLNNGEWISLNTIPFLTPSYNLDFNIPDKEVLQKRDELFSQYSNEIKKGDLNVADKIESTVLKLAEEKVKNKSSYEFFKAGVGKFKENYKKMSIMTGAIENPYSKKVDILKTNYMGGLSKEEYPITTNLTLIGGYSRGVNTQKSGYNTKKINNATQSIQLDESDSDCKTNYCLETVIPKVIKSMFVNRYIKEGNNLILLTEKNIDRYVDKPVKLRSPMFCKSEKICNKCAGELYYKLGTRNVGLFSSNMTGAMLNISMKKFHASGLKFSKINVSDFIVKH